MKAVKRKITDMTVDELKDVIHEAIAENMEVWRETFEIMADSKLKKGTGYEFRDAALSSALFDDRL
jgi:hypothetical protein